MKKIHNNFSKPSKQQIIILLDHYKAGRYVDAEKQALSITRKFPKHQFALKVLAASLKQNGKIKESLVVCQKSVKLYPNDAEGHSNLGVLQQMQSRLKEAETSFRQSISLNPGYAEVHNNLGNTLQGQGRLKESETSFRQSISLKPDYAEAHCNLGNILQIQGRLNEAETSYKKAIVLKPNFAKAYNNFGVLLKDLGKLSEACSSFIQAINLNPNFNNAYENLSITIKNVRFNSSNVNLYPLLIRLLNTGNFVRPNDLAHSILSLLKHDNLIKNLLIKENFPSNINDLVSVINKLDKLKLLHHLMRLCPLPDIKFERFFIAIRSLILSNLDDIDTSTEFIYFLSSLSLQCFINEYIYIEKEKETKLVQKLENEIIETISISDEPEIKKILCLASYRPLHKYDWCQKLKNLNSLEEVWSRLIEEPCTERAIVSEIPKLEEITDKISQKVRGQYEENPYPRWVKTGIPTKKKSIFDICTEINLNLHSKNIINVIEPSILIAGCGTGQHSIGVASNISDSKITAVDLSLASLAYAKRKTIELGITNLEYFQADILKLDHLEKKFDIIESMGVLHHMDEPMVGWKVLTKLLKPGGLMKIGLYSELGRQNIVEIRKEIKSMKVGVSKTEMRKLRQSIAESIKENHMQLTESSDFYSLSMLRDLIFHVQEHRFTLPQIKNCLEELGLKFCGFTTKEDSIKFRKFYGKDKDICDLELWHNYEKSNPRAFAAMYQFWCQKV